MIRRAIRRARPDLTQEKDMHRNIKRALLGVLIGGGISLLGPVAAQAAETSGDDGIGSGTQALIDVDLPVTVAGNALSLLGDALSSGATTSAPPAQPTATSSSATTSGAGGLLSGTQGIISVSVPVTVGGNAISVVGDSTTTDATTQSAPASSGGDGVQAVTSGSDAVASGTQVVAPISVPVTIGGNAISLIGDSTTTDAVTTGATDTTIPSAACSDSEQSTLGATQLNAPISVPGTIGGNAITPAGDSTTTAAAPTVAPGTTGRIPPTTGGGQSSLGVSPPVAPISVPVTIGGNAISLIGDSTTTDAVTTGATDT